jgi:Potassium-transporting ATPase A subunit
MTAIGWIQIILYCAIIAALAKPLGWYMTRVFNGERTFLSPILRPVEAGLYWISGIDDKREQHWPHEPEPRGRIASCRGAVRRYRNDCATRQPQE